MKRVCITLFCLIIILSGCGQNTDNNVDVNKTDKAFLKAGDEFYVTGIVQYSDEPSDIGREYCFVTGDKKLDYVYTDIYDEESKWSSEVFYTRSEDTEILKEYIGEKVTVSGTFDAECHGIPYITGVEVKE